MKNSTPASVTHDSSFFVKLFEIARYGFAGFGFFYAYSQLNSHQASAALHVLTLWVVVSLTGLTGLESLFFSKATATSKGRELNSPYQIQSGMNNLAVAITALIVYFATWGIYAEATVVTVMLTFFTLSSINHGIEYARQQNKKTIHLLRPIFTIILILACLPILFHALKIM